MYVRAERNEHAARLVLRDGRCRKHLVGWFDRIVSTGLVLSILVLSLFLHLML